MLLKMKDMIYKDAHTLYQKNLKANTKLLDQIQGLHKKLNVKVICISNLNGDRMAKIWECDILKKENKVLYLKVTSLERKLLLGGGQTKDVTYATVKANCDGV
jgi:hypothetical protein